MEDDNRMPPTYADAPPEPDTCKTQPTAPAPPPAREPEESKALEVCGAPSLHGGYNAQPDASASEQSSVQAQAITYGEAFTPKIPELKLHRALRVGHETSERHNTRTALPQKDGQGAKRPGPRHQPNTRTTSVGDGTLRNREEPMIPKPTTDLP